LTQESENQTASGDELNRLTAPQTDQPPAWGRIDRKRLFIWAGIGLVAPGGLLFALHRIGSSNSSFTVQNELPTKFIMAFFVSLATWIVSRIEKRSLDEYGIPPRQAFGIRFWEGSIWGFAMLSLILLLLWVSGHFRIDSQALAGSAILRWGLAWGATFLAVSWSEELAFRGYWLFSMSRRMRFWPAALFLSAVFAGAHLANHGENVFGILQVAEIGLLFCLTLRRTGNLWFAIGFHAAWDWAETFFYGTPDSGLLGVGRFFNSSAQGPRWLTGGSAGPEGSVVAFLVILVCAVLIHFRFPKPLYPDRPV
jgi:CAAX protease family protein